MQRYAQRHDALADEHGVSRLSPYLRFGCLSPAEVEARLPHGEGGEELARQLCWRDFFRHLLHHFPETVSVELQQRRHGTIAWASDEQA